jgi:hypothetical protein
MMTDPDGRQWSMSITKDGKGNTMINIFFTGVIYNSTGKRYDVKGFENKIKAQIEKVFNKDGVYNDDGKTTISSKIQVDLKTVNSIDEISSTDHIIELVNPDNAVWDGGGNTSTGRSPMGGLRVYLNFDNIGKIMSGEDNNTVPHELGHTLGLIHPEDFSRGLGWNSLEQYLNLENNGDNQANFMLTFFSQNKYHTRTYAFNVSSAQLHLMESNYRNGDLNKQINFRNHYSPGVKVAVYNGLVFIIPTFYKTRGALDYPKN